MHRRDLLKMTTAALAGTALISADAIASQTRAVRRPALAKNYVEASDGTRLFCRSRRDASRSDARRSRRPDPVVCNGRNCRLAAITDSHQSPRFFGHHTCRFSAIDIWRGGFRKIFPVNERGQRHRREREHLLPGERPQTVDADDIDGYYVKGDRQFHNSAEPLIRHLPT